jgi:hypothetical protein
MSNRVRGAFKAKFTKAITALHAKAIENVSGKILQVKTGQLRDSIKKESDSSSDPMIGSVFVDPVTPKALALEYGGKGSYPIDPINGMWLKFYWERIGEVVFLDHVNHPPSHEYRYLGEAMDEMQSKIPIEFQEALLNAIAGYEEYE